MAHARDAGRRRGRVAGPFGLVPAHQAAAQGRAGSDRYRMLVEAGGNPDDWVAEWEETLRDFASIREEYLLYRATDPHWA